MSVWKGIYLTSLLFLAFVLVASFTLATYYTVTTIGGIRDQAASETLSRLPTVETFLGGPISSGSVEKRTSDEINKMWWWDRFKYNLRSDLYSYGNSIPFSVLIASIVMLVTVFSAYMLRKRLVVVSESRRSFESLMMALFGYGAFVLGFVYSWSTYSVLAAQVNTRPETAVYTYEPGLQVVDQVVSSLSVGLIVAFFGVLLACYAVIKGFRAYARLNLKEANYAYKSLPPFARHLR